MQFKLKFLSGVLAMMLGLLCSYSASARYLPDFLVAPEGMTDMLGEDVRNGWGSDSLNFSQGRFFLHGIQPDGKIVWKDVTIDPARVIPKIEAGMLHPVDPEHLELRQYGVVASSANASGARWIVRAHSRKGQSPGAGDGIFEFYSDLVGAGTSAWHINMGEIRARMPRSTYMDPENPVFLNVNIDNSGNASALITFDSEVGGYLMGTFYQSGTLALLRWNRDSIVANEIVPHIEWVLDLGKDWYGQVLPDAQGGLWVIDGLDVRRVAPDGTWDTRFAQNGVLKLPPYSFEYGHQVAMLSDGGAWVGNVAYLVRINSNGQVLARVEMGQPVRDGKIFRVVKLFAEADDSVLAVLTHRSELLSETGTYIVQRYTPAGALDVQYGLQGVETIPVNLPVGAGFLPRSNQGLALRVGDKIHWFRLEPAQSDATEITVQMIEFYNSISGHYFMTADQTEIDRIDTGQAGAGWSRTRQTFRSYRSLRNAPVDAVELCHFSGNDQPDPTSPNGRRGPDSHFYTLAGAECSNLYKNDHAWRYEGAHLAMVPLTDNNTCRAGLQVVYRVYNNGDLFSADAWIKNDGNHRYTTSREIAAEMEVKGWIIEGPVFCVPN